ncbi:hypothetical protein [Pseudomonas violetae]|uniref:RNase NYN domain-containing protein n=1 Tax=Pseudomonas violetae TaxID=2915813 RepID=A0ABT0ESM8_9PSED|nr:hypothetical protein [Pseudomonas violetae]MCK1788733.1 hypothetical protein [Pseudomonas violetae]
MYSNVHATQLQKQRVCAGQIVLEIGRRQAEYDWFSAFDFEQASTKLASLKRAASAGESRLAELTIAIDSNQSRLDTLKSSSDGWLSIVWRSSEQTVAHRQIPEMHKRVALLRESERGEREMLDKYEKEEFCLSADLRRYRAFKPLEEQATITSLGVELARLQEEIEQTRAASENWEATVGDVLRQWKQSELVLAKIMRDIRQAEAFEQDLSRAATSRDKAIIHQTCESQFGNSRPSSVLSGLRTQQRKQTRDAEKIESRLIDVIRLVEKRIETLIIDGNNLCYEPVENAKGRFIGLTALKALVPHLCRTYKVSVIFDPGIRQRISMDDASLREIFPEAKVMVMRSKAKADEGLLAAAEFDKSAYIISNDRFADYPEHPAVLERRLLTHMVHPRSIQVQQLQLNVPYEV